MAHNSLCFDELADGASRQTQGNIFGRTEWHMNDAWMQSLLGGGLGEILAQEKHDLYKMVQNTDKWAVIRGGAGQEWNSCDHVTIGGQVAYTQWEIVYRESAFRR